MLKRVLWIILALGILGVFPVLAQQSQPADGARFIPADYAGFIRVHLGDDAGAALRGLNISAFVAARLEPQRITLPSTALSYDNLIPFTTIFDTDTVTFADTILPWLNGEMVLAYRTFDGAIQVDPKDVLMILPVKGVLEATSKLSAVIKAQDLPKQETYRNVNIYIGDTSAFAVTSDAVFVGTTEAVQTALDIQAGAADRLVDSPIYASIQSAIPADALVSAYIGGDYILPAINGLLNGEADSQPILAAFGEALGQMRTDSSLETKLLNGGFDGAGASIRLEDDGATFIASAFLHSASPSDASPTEFDSTLLNMMPRSAMLVQSGTDASGLVHDVVAALPVSTFVRQIFNGWPIQILGTDNSLSPAPSALEIQSAASSFLTALSAFNKFNLQTDLLDHLSGNYVIGLIPRPNNPVPMLNVPFDMLIVAQSDDAAAAQTGVSTLLQALFHLQSQTVDAVDGWNFTGVGDGKNVVFRIGTQGKLLVIATGTADADALRAMGGDNRLVDQSAWQDLTTDGRPDLYLDLLAFYNTFFPSAGGSSPGAGVQMRLTLRTPQRTDGLSQVDLRVTVPLG